MTNELPKTYDPSATEDKLYKTWEEKGYFNAEVDKNKKPFTIVIPPPNVTVCCDIGMTVVNQRLDDVNNRVHGLGCARMHGSRMNASTGHKLLHALRFC